MNNTTIKQTWKQWGNTITIVLMVVVVVFIMVPILLPLLGEDASVLNRVMLVVLILVASSPLVYIAYHEENKQVKNKKYKKNKIKQILEVDDFQILYKDYWEKRIIVGDQIYMVTESQDDILGIERGKKLIYSRQLERLRAQIEDILEIDNFQEVEIDEGRDVLLIQANDTDYVIHTAGNKVIYVTTNEEVIYQVETQDYN